MTESDRKRFGVAIAALYASRPNSPELTEAALEACWIGLSDVPMDRVYSAVKKSIRRGGPFVPVPSELRALAGMPTMPYHAPYIAPQTRHQIEEMRKSWLALPAMKEPKS